MRKLKMNYVKNHISNASKTKSFAYFFVLQIFALFIFEISFATAMVMPNGSLVPHYFGPYPNYANSPMPVGAITNITLNSGGAGYNSPIVVINDAYNTGSGATATAIVSGGIITGITITNSGIGYSAPIVTIIDATGMGAGATAAAKIGGTLTGGIRKFVDSMPGLGPAGNNTLGKYIPVAVADTTTYPGSDYYELAVIEFEERMHSDLPLTKWRGYVQLETPANIGTSKHVPLKYPSGSPILKPDGTPAIGYDSPHYLGPIIVATKNISTRIKFTNLLPTGAGGNLFIPVDKTVMGSGMGPLDMPGMPGMKEDYTQNRATLHLHGGLTPWISDGTTHQWTTPAGENTQYPKGVSTEYVPDMWFVNGNVIPNTVGQTTPPVAGATNDPGNGSMTFYYPNQQSARLMFYHDHAFGITRLNVYAGEASGYILTDQVEQDLIGGTDLSGVNPTLAKVLPDIGIPIIIQDKTFVDANTIAMQDPTWQWGSMPGMFMTGDIWMPHVYMPNQNPYDPTGANPFGRWDYGPWFFPPTTNLVQGPIPNPYYDPINSPWEPPMVPGVPTNSMAMEAFMDTPIVNGQAYPYLELDPKAYRFRILAAANDRFFNLQLYVADPNSTTSDGRNNTEIKMVPALANPAFPAKWPTDGRVGGVPDPAMRGPDMIQIGTEGGFLPAPAVITNQPVTWNMNPKTFNYGNVQDHSLLLGAAERADVIIDFSQYAGKTLILYNDAPAAFPARDPRYDYYTDDPDQVSTGGAPPTKAGYGPNTRTIMQIRIKNITPAAPYDLAALQAAFIKTPTKKGVFETSQDPIIVAQNSYNSAYNAIFPANAFVGIADSNMTFKTISNTILTIPFEPKAIHDEMGGVYDEYGRLSGMLGLELPIRVPGAANFIGYAYMSPPVDIVSDSMTPLSPVLDDGTQLWRITHNGIDTHAMHFHLFNVQLINRVAWDNSVLLPDANELGWKETVRVNPLEDTIVALRPIAPTMPFDLPNSIRLIDPTSPEGTTLKNGGVGTYTDPKGTPVTITNHFVNFGWEYVWHCHILGHEEMDMMHELSVAVAPKAPTALTGNLNGTTAMLNWMDNSISETNYTIQRSSYSAGPWNTLAIISGNGKTKGPMDYEDIGINSSAKYFYRVLATNIVGDTVTPGFPMTIVHSLPSNVVSQGSGTACVTTADTNVDGIIDMPEILVYVSQWKSGNVSMTNLLQGINFWKIGSGC